MADVATLRLAFGWWNTSLSPPRKESRWSHETGEVAIQVVRSLLDDYGIDCLGLGEVSVEDMDAIYQACDSLKYGIVDRLEENRRRDFLVGVLFNREKLIPIDSKFITTDHASHSWKNAYRIAFTAVDTPSPLFIFVSHWPSRRFLKASNRDMLALNLKSAIDEIRSKFPGEAQIVLLGDYNDEPFNDNLSECLLSSRDRRLVMKSADKLLYNPFWRQLGEREPHIPNKKSQQFSGSHYYAGGDSTHWTTFDQIIFSSTFLHGDHWHLNEQHSAILEIPPLDSLLPDRKTIFDHFPVISVLEKIIQIEEQQND